MSPLLDIAIKVSLVLLLAIVTGDWLDRRSAALRHWTLAIAVVCAAALPFVAWLAPAWQLPAQALASAPAVLTTSAPVTSGAVVLLEEPQDSSATDGVRSPVNRAARTKGSAPPPTVVGLFFVAWAAGAAITLFALAAGLVRLAWLSRSATKIHGGRWTELVDEISRTSALRRRVTILLSDRSTILGTWGLVRPRILLPAAAREWSDERLRIVLSHELAHVQRGDWALQLIGEALRGVYWFNPLTWIACARLRRESEHACDDAVLSKGVSASEYASHLIDLARTLHAGRHPWLPAPAMARPSSLEGRISAMLKSSINRTPPTRWSRLAAVVALLALTVTIAGFGAQSFFTFSGSVVDSTDRFIPNTTLVVTNADSRAKHEVRTDGTGRFEFVGLPPGDYALEVRVPGFSTFKDTFVVIGRNIERVVELQVGSLEETINVVGGASASADQRPRRQELSRDRIEELRVAAQARCEGGVGATGGAIVPPHKVVSVNPLYPEGLRVARVGGVVTAEAVIGVDGSIQEVRNVTSPQPELEAAALEALRQWQFSPTLLNCTPTEVRMMVTMRFSPEP